ncbi:MAG: molybdopterin molybdotransferase MoeA [Deltaproteobacteria bacterium]|nr:molybdopterin molybdotransferase MoeA [Deltaproteobacteria bacterium]
MKQSGSEPNFIGFEEAFKLAHANVPLLSEELRPTHEALGRIASRPIPARVDSPSVDASLKDGYAVRSVDVATATPSSSIELRLVGSVGAGGSTVMELVPGAAIRILSGAVIPRGADAVLAEEFAVNEGDIVKVFADAHSGRNILTRGTDVNAGETLVQSGEKLTPAKVGILVAGGVTEVWVYRRPRVGLLATGDEVLLLDRPMDEGKVYASNIALQEAWLCSLGLDCMTGVCGDSSAQIISYINSMLSDLDVLVTSGGAWTGDRDLIAKAMDQLGWRPIFHRVRMGPGKAVRMGLLNGKPIFCLPGGPPSNEMAFFMIVLPALLRMSGCDKPPFPKFYGRLTQEISGQLDWTQFIHCSVLTQDSEFRVVPLNMTRRLSAMSRTQAIVKIPEGIERLDSRTVVPFTMVDGEYF